MPERDVERPRSVIDAYNARDIEAFIRYCDRQLEFHAAWVGVAPTLYVGHAGLRRWHQELEDAWDEIALQPDEYFDLGDRVLTFATQRGRGRHSAVEDAMPVGFVARWPDGLMIYRRGYLDRADALRDLGVTEDELEPIAP